MTKQNRLRQELHNAFIARNDAGLRADAGWVILDCPDELFGRYEND